MDTPNSTLDAAASAFSQLLKGRVAGDSGLLDPSRIEVTKQLNYNALVPQRSTDEVMIRVTLPEGKLQNSAYAMQASAAAVSALKDIPGLKQQVVLETPEEYAQRMKSEIAYFRDKGAAIPVGLESQWKGLDTSYGANTISDYALHISKSDQYGINVTIAIPKREGTDVNAEAHALASVMAANMADTKKTLAERPLKYLPALTDHEKALLHDLQLETVVRDSEKFAEVTLRISSKAQKSASASGETLTPEGIAQLAATNPLNKLNDAQLGKVMGRAVLMKCDCSFTPEYLPYLGRNDMKSLLGRALAKVPSKDRARADALLNEDMLLNLNQWDKPAGERSRFKVPPTISTDRNDPDSLRIVLSMPAGKGDEIISRLAGLQAESPAFATVDSVELIHAPTPEIAQQLGIMLKSLMNANAAVSQGIAQNGDENAIKPYAEQMVQSVSEAYSALERATAMAAKAPKNWSASIAQERSAPSSAVPTLAL